MTRIVQLLVVVVVLIGCAHQTPNDAKANCHVESGWLDSTSGCSARAGYPDCYRVCPDGSRVRVQNEGDAGASSKEPPPRQ